MMKKLVTFLRKATIIDKIFMIVAPIIIILGLIAEFNIQPASLEDTNIFKQESKIQTENNQLMQSCYLDLNK